MATHHEFFWESVRSLAKAARTLSVVDIATARDALELEITAEGKLEQIRGAQKQMAAARRDPAATTEEPRA